MFSPRCFLIIFIVRSVSRWQCRFAVHRGSTYDFPRCVPHGEGIGPMRMLSGAILILAAEQAFAHAYQIGFPHQVFARTILLPLAGVLFLSGIYLLVKGYFRDQKPS